MKLKTKKTFAKKIRITKNGKMLFRGLNRDKITVRGLRKKSRVKNSLKKVSKADQKSIKKYLPYL